MSNSGEIEAFIIHLARAEARRPQVDRILAASPVPASIIDAVDGRALSTGELQAAYSRKSLHAPRYPFALGVGEIGCFLSHRKAWQAIVDKGLEAGLVIEDDVEMVPNFPVLLEQALNVLSSNDYIRLITKRSEIPFRVRYESSDVCFFEPQVVGYGMLGQLVTRDAAIRLLANSAIFDRPVDAFIQMWWESGINVVCTKPAAIEEISAQLGGTTIQGGIRRSIWSKCCRTVARAVYRKRIRARSRSQARK